MSREIRWGMMATGLIAITFTKDLLLDPKTRGVNDFVHTVTAVASSSGKSRAEEFIKEVGASPDAKAYGSYEELASDPDVDIMYISTPHSHHYQNVMLCLEKGKHVLCEKAFTVNAAQARKLAEKAREKNLVLIEAVWTRYFPLSIYVRNIITSGKIGNVLRVQADNSVNFHPSENWADGKHRMVNPDLAGGAMLDCGIYALTWVFQCLYTTQPPGKRHAPKVASFCSPYKPTGVDDISTILLSFPRDDGPDAHAIATTAISLSHNIDSKGTAGPAARIIGTEGEIHVMPPAPRPTKTRLILKDGTIEDKDWPQPGPGAGSNWFNGWSKFMQKEGEGQGMFWEADEAASAIIEGRKEGKFLDLEESIVIMEVMDTFRQQNNIKLPEKIESTEYPLKLD